MNVALIQTDLYWEDIDANLAKFEEIIRGIESTIDFIVLPEMFTTGFCMNPNLLAEPHGGKTFKWMNQIAQYKKAAITGSYIVKENGNFYNRLYFVYPNGNWLTYDKNHLFTLAGENISYTSGNDSIIINYNGWRLKPLICYDLRFPKSSFVKTQKENYEYDLLFYVANWPEDRVEAWDTLLKARAIENVSYCIGVNRTGKDDNNKKYTGHSSIFKYNGNKLAYSEKNEDILLFNLSLTNLNKFREKYNFLDDAKCFDQ